jgi:DNA-directed RNA polymerase specialized sigma24 family protein
VSSDLIARAAAGDEDAFRELVDPHRRELHVHCYRILGSTEDAEDALQETLLAAWQGLARFERRASIRTWLYRVATNRCLNTLSSASYVRDPGGRVFHVMGLLVLTLAGDQISAITRFDKGVLPRFGLPRKLTS